MDKIFIDNELVLFNIFILNLIFKKYSGLEKDSYSIGKIIYPDGTYVYFFEYPPEYSEVEADELLLEIANKVSMFNTKDLFDELKNIE